MAGVVRVVEVGIRERAGRLRSPESAEKTEEILEIKGADRVEEKREQRKGAIMIRLGGNEEGS